MKKPTISAMTTTFKTLHELAQMEPPTPEGREAVSTLWHAAAIVSERGNLVFLNRKCPLTGPTITINDIRQAFRVETQTEKTQAAELIAAIRQQDKADAIDAANDIEQLRKDYWT